MNKGFVGRRALWIGALIAVVLAGCGGNKEGDKTGGGSGAGGGGANAKVVVSIFPLYDVTRRIAGDRLSVKLVLPPGKSEHAYEPSPREIAELDGAKLAIAVGLDMDEWVEPLLKSVGSPKVVHVGALVKTMPIDVEPIEDEEGEHHDDHDDEKAGSAESAKRSSGSAAKHDDHDDDHDHDAKQGSAGSAGGAGSGSGKREEHEEHHHHEVGAPDPHVWMDPERMTQIADAIAAELTTLDPAGKDTYAKNVAAVKASIADTDTKTAARTKAFSKRTIVTFHGSMAYFAKRYDIRIAAVVEPIAGKEPTASYIADVIKAIQVGKAVALFTEPQLERAPGETIAKQANIPLGELDPVGGVPGRDSYEKLLTWNTDQLEKALK